MPKKEEPYNADFCRAQSCEHLSEADKCELDECVYNHKWVVYWETHGHLPSEE